MRTTLYCCGLFILTLSLHAATIAQWNFNSVPPDADTGTGTLTASTGTGVATLTGGTVTDFATGSTNDPAATDNSGWNTKSYPAQGASNRTAGVQFDVNTVGFSNIMVRWDQKVSATASKYYRLLYSLDGTSFTQWPVGVGMQKAPTASTYYEAQTNDFTTVAGVNDNPRFSFRIVSEFESTATGTGSNGYVTTYGTNAYGSGGTVRFDMVTVTGTALPWANTAPNITAVSNQTLRVNQSVGPLSFEVFDQESDSGLLQMAKSSSNPAIIAEPSILLGGAGRYRTATITASPQAGESTITLWAIDPGGKSNSTTFTVTVLPTNTPPWLSAIGSTNTVKGTPTAPLAFSVGDLESQASDLSVSAVSHNKLLVPDTGIVLGGGGSNRTVTLVPAPGQVGVAPVTVSVGDGVCTNTVTFALAVTPAASVLFYDNFDYPDGSIVTNSGNLWAGRYGIPGECQAANHQLQITSLQGEDVVATLGGGPYARSNHTALYAAFKATFLGLPKNTPEYFAHFGSGSTHRGRLFAGTTNATAGTYRLFVANGSDTNVMFATDLVTNRAYQVVLRYDIDAVNTRLWVDPASEAAASVTATDIVASSSISLFSFRQDAGLGTTVLVDELRVGLSFADVAQSSTVERIALNYERGPSGLTLRWTSPTFVLQAGPTVTGPFTNVPGAANPFLAPFGPGKKFFRLKLN